MLDLLDAEAYADAGRRGPSASPRGCADAFDAAGIAVRVAGRRHRCVGLFFGAERAGDYDVGPAHRRGASTPRFFHAMLDRGVALAPGAYEVLFPGLAHADAVLDEIVAEAADAAAAVADAPAEARPAR